MTKPAKRSLGLLFAIGVASLCACGGEAQSAPFKLAISEYRQDLAQGEYRLRVTTTNTSSSPLHLDGCAPQRGWYTISIRLDGVPLVEKNAEARKQREGKMRRSWCASASAKDILKPGDSYQDILGVTGVFDISSPGAYEIAVSRDTAPDDPDKSVTVKSNTITIVVPEPRPNTDAPQ